MTNNIALKPYVDEIKSICDDLSVTELSNFIIELAKEVPTLKRKDFLHKLKSYLTSESEYIEDNKSDILKEIDSLKEEVTERQSSIEDGTYYDDLDYDDEEYDPYGEECPDSLSENQKTELEGFFKQADKLFLSNKLEEAKSIYEALISFFGFDDSKDEEYPNLNIWDIDINWKETLARYCRCVYETSSSDNRVSSMIEALKINLSQFATNYNIEKENHPFLQDIYDTKADEPPDWNVFLNSWKEVMRGKTNNRAFVLFLESVDKTDGLERVEAEVKKYKVSAGYLYLLNQLVKKGSWENASIIAQEAIKNISDSLRLDASKILIPIGEQLKDNNLILKAKREVFFFNPDNASLSQLVEEAKKQDVRDAELKKAATYLKCKDEFKDIRIKVLLMLGQLDEAVSIVESEKNVGWSSESEIGLSFSGLLIALTKANIEAKTQESLLNRYIGSMYSFSYSLKAKDEEIIICQEILYGLKNVLLDDSAKDELTKLVETTARARIDAIVSNKHRSAYERAAEILGALAEYFVLENNKQKAFSLVNEFKNQKYKAYRAFKSEVDSVLKKSPLLINSIKS